MNKILFISRDPGGTNQLVALRELLLGQKDEAQKKALYVQLGLSGSPEITIVAKDYARGIWMQNSVEPLNWPNLRSSHDIINYLLEFNIDQIVTSTSHLDDRTEQVIWRLASRISIKTTAFLDYDLNLEARFRDDKGRKIFPSQVAVINQSAIEPLTVLGMEKKNIFVAGNLYQEYIKKQGVSDVKNRLYSIWQADEREKLILFASDYIREMQALGMTFDVTEFECLDCLIEILSSKKDTSQLKGISEPYRLIIRPHPKDRRGKYDRYLSKNTDNLTIIIDQNGTSVEAVSTSNMVAGLGSSLLDEARILGVETLELGPIVKRRKDQQKTVS